MLISHHRTIDYHGAPAELMVVRNDGYCWGRIVTAAGQHLDVDPPTEDGAEVDLYDETDTDALDVLEAQARDDANVSPAIGHIWS